MAIPVTGSKKWAFITANIDSSPAIGPDGIIYTGSDGEYDRGGDEIVFFGSGPKESNNSLSEGVLTFKRNGVLGL